MARGKGGVKEGLKNHQEDKDARIASCYAEENYAHVWHLFTTIICLNVTPMSGISFYNLYLFKCLK